MEMELAWKIPRDHVMKTKSEAEMTLEWQSIVKSSVISRIFLLRETDANDFDKAAGLLNSCIDALSLTK
ncbi:uncharacterized protein PHALS_11529 [Plasmopara halstedii]|uniref:Uncharacterized protein n=1 Tax=Plasmopara halstedii TaxID=4781 RepID=A0A0P1A676_PLAHL|nr:uncharacterized protein PHALS_11529 [Plasmopara halstedii]CEG35661.1 hypothetical protein PHALS_11529 [Plasmopara halstedii]|eukprot:XP_024572030.1 hypothetical protein PHALS_11529 [Plasmopara halstedii]